MRGSSLFFNPTLRATTRDPSKASKAHKMDAHWARPFHEQSAYARTTFCNLQLYFTEGALAPPNDHYREYFLNQNCGMFLLLVCELL